MNNETVTAADAVELEIKYSISSPDQGEEIFMSSFIGEMAIPESRETVEMRAVYFDDESRTLASHHIGYRIRKENSVNVATLKWPHVSGGGKKEGYARRSEVNIEVNDETPDLSIFSDVVDDRELLTVLSSVKPKVLFTSDCTRKLLAVRFRDSEIEMSYDFGDLTSGSFTEPVMELECELKSGKEADLLELGSILCRDFGLKPLNKSKLSRGLALAALAAASDSAE